MVAIVEFGEHGIERGAVDAVVVQRPIEHAVPAAPPSKRERRAFDAVETGRHGLQQFDPRLLELSLARVRQLAARPDAIGARVKE